LGEQPRFLRRQGGEVRRRSSLSEERERLYLPAQQKSPCTHHPGKERGGKRVSGAGEKESDTTPTGRKVLRGFNHLLEDVEKSKLLQRQRRAINLISVELQNRRSRRRGDGWIPRKSGGGTQSDS